MRFETVTCDRVKRPCPKSRIIGKLPARKQDGNLPRPKALLVELRKLSSLAISEAMAPRCYLAAIHRDHRLYRASPIEC
jgi:hypothetical protein